MTNYTVTGRIVNFQNSKLYVELLDDDQHWFDDRVDDLLGSSWTDNNGKFTISFDNTLYKENWFEGKPDLFIIVRNESGKIIHKSEIKHPSGPNDARKLNFDIMIQNNNPMTNDPYNIDINQRTALFARMGESIDLNDNVVNSSRLLMQTINAWLLYTNEAKWNAIGYDGPQVERYPWRNSHKHILRWNI